MKKRIALVFLLAFVLCLAGCSSEATSIGIIGGADGPTAIFVTSNVNWLSICGLIAAILVIVLVVLTIYRHKKKK